MMYIKIYWIWHETMKCLMKMMKKTKKNQLKTKNRHTHTFKGEGAELCKNKGVNWSKKFFRNFKKFQIFYIRSNIDCLKSEIIPK